MPNNFRHIGLIYLILPNARIIDARREPMACCFGNLKQLFAQGQELPTAPTTLPGTTGFMELMRHWDAVLPGRVLHVHHEDVVDDLEGWVRRILDFCSLEFEPGSGVSQDFAKYSHRRAQSRCGSLSTGRASISGGTTSPGWVIAGSVGRCCYAVP